MQGFSAPRRTPCISNTKVASDDRTAHYRRRGSNGNFSIKTLPSLWPAKQKTNKQTSWSGKKTVGHVLQDMLSSDNVRMSLKLWLHLYGQRLSLWATRKSFIPDGSLNGAAIFSFPFFSAGYAFWTSKRSSYRSAGLLIILLGSWLSTLLCIFVAAYCCRSFTFSQWGPSGSSCLCPLTTACQLQSPIQGLTWVGPA